MFKKIPAIALSLVLVGALFFAATMTGLAADKVKLTFSARGKDADRVALWEKWADRFEESHPNVDVEFLPVAGAYYDKIGTQIAGGAAPDVVWMGTGFLDLYDVLMPLDDLIARNPALKQIHPGALRGATWQGEVRALPFGLNTHTVYYNKDMLNEAGLRNPTDDWTWDDAMDMAKQLTQDKDGDGSPEQYGLNVYWQPIAYGYGGDVFSEDGRKILINRPATIKTLQLFADLKSGKAGVQPPPGFEPASSLTPLMNGITAMAHRGVFDVPKMRSNVNFDWDVVGMPATVVDGKRYRSTFYSPETWAIPITTKHPELAKEFLAFMFQKKQALEFASLGAVIPSQLDVAQESFFQINPPQNIRAFVDALNYVTGQYWAHPANVRPAIRGDLYQKILAGDVAVATVIGEMERQANEIIADYWAKK